MTSDETPVRPDEEQLVEIAQEVLGDKVALIDGKPCYLVRKPIPGKKIIDCELVWETWREHVQDIRVDMLYGMKNHGFKPCKLARNDVEDLVINVAKNHIANPIRDRLDELCKWYSDQFGDEPPQSVLEDIGEQIGFIVPQLKDNPELHHAYVKAAVALVVFTAIERAYHPVAVQRCLILYDNHKGGVGKSSFAKAIASVIDNTDPEMVSGRFYGTMTAHYVYSRADLRDCLYSPRIGRFITEMSECDNLFTVANEDNLKNLINDSEAVIRFAYGRDDVHVPWTDALIGTTNNPSFLTDVNNRRWMIVEKSDVADDYGNGGFTDYQSFWKSDSLGKHIHLAKHPEVARELVAECVYLYKEIGMRWSDFFEDDEVKKAIELVNADHVYLDDGVQEYLSYIERNTEDDVPLPRSTVNKAFDEDFGHVYRRDKAFMKTVYKFLNSRNIGLKNINHKVGCGLDTYWVKEQCYFLVGGKYDKDCEE